MTTTRPSRRLATSRQLYTPLQLRHATQELRRHVGMGNHTTF